MGFYEYRNKISGFANVGSFLATILQHERKQPDSKIIMLIQKSSVF
jgi:hypothetical protein